MADSKMQEFQDPEIVDWIKHPDQHGGIKRVVVWIIKRLRQHGLAYDFTLPPSLLGIHPSNRGAYGANEQTVHSLLDDIVSLGWDWAELGSDPLAVEEDPSSRYIETFNIELTSGSELLAPVEKGTLRAGTITNSHTVQGLRALIAGVTCDKKNISIGGKMSLAHVESKDPEVAKAATVGWRWTVLSHRCRSLYGDQLFELLSSTKNVGIARSETEVEVLLKIFRLAKKYEERQAPIEWTAIMDVAKTTKPKCIDVIPTLVGLIKHSGQFVVEFSKFHAKFVPNERYVGQDFFNTIVTFSVKGEDDAVHHVPLVRWGCLKAEYSCPANKVINSECKFIKPSEIEGMCRKDPKSIIEAESILSLARQIVSKVDADVSEDVKVTHTSKHLILRILL